MVVSMKEDSNPYWDEIKDRLDEVTDGMNLSIGLPPRREMYQMRAGKMMDLLTRNPYQRMEEIDPAAYMEQYNRSLDHHRNDFRSLAPQRSGRPVRDVPQRSRRFQDRLLHRRYRRELRATT